MIKIEKKYYIIPLIAYYGKRATVEKKKILVEASVRESNYDTNTIICVLDNVKTIVNPYKDVSICRDCYVLKTDPKSTGEFHIFRFRKENLERYELKGIDNEDAAKLLFEMGE